MTRIRSVLASLVLLVAASAVAAPAVEEAKRLYASGNQHFALAEYELAIADFKEAYRLREDPVFLYNIAQSYHQLNGQEETALKLYRSYLQKAPDARNRGEVERKIEELDRVVQARYAQQQQPGPPSQPVQTPPPAYPGDPNRGAPMAESPSAAFAVALAFSWAPSANGAAPPGAFVGGEENGRPLIVCRAPFKNGTQPGKLVAKNCNFVYGGVEIQAPTYDVLVAAPSSIAWVPSGGDGALPPSAIIVGNEGSLVYPLCRASWQGGVHPGRVTGAQCAIGYGGREVRVPRYEIAVAAAPQPPVQQYAPAPVAPRALDAGPIWNNGDAQQKCPRVCGRARATWNGGWRTVVAGRNSTCDCVPNP